MLSPDLGLQAIPALTIDLSSPQLVHGDTYIAISWWDGVGVGQSHKPQHLVYHVTRVGTPLSIKNSQTIQNDVWLLRDMNVITQLLLTISMKDDVIPTSLIIKYKESLLLDIFKHVIRYKYLPLSYPPLFIAKDNERCEVILTLTDITY